MFVCSARLDHPLTLGEFPSLPLVADTFGPNAAAGFTGTKCCHVLVYLGDFRFCYGNVEPFVLCLSRVRQFWFSCGGSAQWAP